MMTRLNGITPKQTATAEPTPELCQQCGRFEAELHDPTFNAETVLPGTKPLFICYACAKTNIEDEMLRQGTVIQ